MEPSDVTSSAPAHGHRLQIATWIILAGICALSISIRIFPVALWGSVIHEYDPQFNFRVTKFLSQYGIQDLLSWFDDRAWYPLGRSVGTTLYPGLMLAASSIQYVLHVLSFQVEIRHICVFLAPLFAALSCISLYFLTKAVTNKTSTSLLSAALLAVSPAYLSRSTAGSYDNEGIAIFLLILTFYCWVQAVQHGSMFFASLTALAYCFMALSWGGYVFILNIIPLHTLVALVQEGASPRVYIAYSSFYPLAMLLSMQVPFIGFNAVLQGESMAANGVFGLLQIWAFATYLRSKLSPTAFAALIKGLKVTALVVIVLIFISIVFFRKMQWSGRSLTLLDPTYASKYIPIIASVGEHQPTNWSNFYLSLGPSMLFMPLGLYYSFERSTIASSFMIVYSITALYFAGIMIRLLLTLAPAACYLSAVGFSELLTGLSLMCQPAPTLEIPPKPEAKTSMRKKKAMQVTPPENEETDFVFIVIAKIGNVLSFRPMKKSFQDTPSPVKLLLVAVTVLLIIHIRHCSAVARKAYSSTSLLFERQNRTTGEYIIRDDLREAYWWLRQNTPGDTKVLSWWDYGYQLSVMSNRTTLVDNNTWNNTHIATVGRVLTSDEDAALPVLESLDIDYIMILFGGRAGTPGDDIDKMSWILRIAEGVFPETTIESEYLYKEKMVVGENATARMQQSLLYKFSYYDFRNEEDGTNYTAMDLNRRVPIDSSGIQLKHFEPAFTTENWIVRLYRRKRQ